MSTKKVSIRVFTQGASEDASLLFASSAESFVIPRSKIDIELSEEALKRALSEIQRFKSITD